MKNERKRFWNWTEVRNEDGAPSGERVLFLSGAIAEESWFDDDVTPKMFHDELFAGTGPVTVWINSPGGDCIAASQIYAAMKDYPGHITVKVDGLAASAASVIAMAGEEVQMAPTAMLMIHNPATMAFGDHNEMKAAIRMLAEVKESIINAYELKTGLSRDEISRLMEQETWMNARKAIELGFADSYIAGDKSGKAEAFAFSGKTSEDSLRRKLVARFTPKDSGVRTQPSISELEVRLNLLK